MSIADLSEPREARASSICLDHSSVRTGSAEAVNSSNASRLSAKTCNAFRYFLARLATRPMNSQIGRTNDATLLGHYHETSTLTDLGQLFPVGIIHMIVQ